MLSGPAGNLLAHRSPAAIFLRGGSLSSPVLTSSGGTLPVALSSGSLVPVVPRLLGGRSCRSPGGLLLLGVEVIGVTPEEGINHDVPALGSVQCATEVLDLTSQEPVQQGDGLLALVVAGDGNVDMLQGGVSVTQGNDRDVGVGSLLHGLAVHAGVSDDEQTRLQVLGGDLIGQGTRHPAASQCLNSSVLGELEHGTGTVNSLRGHDDVSGILDGHDGLGSHHDLLPGHAEVNDVDAIGSAAEDIALHPVVDVASSQMGLTDQHHLA
mmetsp:Transcript_11386/g.16870  ORF Transcript_11386/g.16870 Transcript_11386/m.16870 type:complete len:267 (-) Transcript_11386:9-809(-)